VRKRLLGESYGLASKQLGYRQRNVREDTSESLVSRGMTGGGQAANTLGGQQQADTETQLGLERQDLDLQRRESLAGIKADFSNQALGAVAGGASTAMNVAGAFGIHPLTAEPQGAPTTPQVAIPPTPSVSGAMTGAPGTANWDFHVGG
jgi:hypothetical protein